MSEIYVAHVDPVTDKEQLISDHNHNVADLAASFASIFEGDAVAYNAGLLHDVGKYSSEFQDKIKTQSHKRVDHSTFGAQIAKDNNLLQEAFIIAGHHTGLPDGGSVNDLPEDSTLCGRLKRVVPDASAYKDDISFSELKTSSKKINTVLDDEFFIRMGFSCVVDADFLDTSHFMTNRETEINYDSISVLRKRLMSYLDKKCWLNPASESSISKIRSGILNDCISKGKVLDQGIHTLTVPTGGGKTVSSLAYALTMAERKKMSRVIYVIPYTSIIDQTATVFADILGEENVLEHHSGIEYNIDDDCDDEQKQIVRRKMLATENWDAPVIVTTTVQFFESLFSNKTSKCRKLHNIANSVIIFDEAQSLPFSYLKPCVFAISNLVKHYHCDVVLCTATQPFLDKILSEDIFMGKHYVPDEIIGNTENLYSQMQRTSIKNVGTLHDDEVIAKMCSTKQSLCVVNTRETARGLYHALPQDSYCLTTFLCPAHRKKIISQIKEKLKAGKTCRVVSTSLIEAGVDLDFQMAMREVTGLDSILQTAGRCNREGKRPVSESPVYVFRIANRYLADLNQKKAGAFYSVAKKAEISSLESIKKYFSLYQTLCGDEEMDKKGILNMLANGIDGKIYPFHSVDEMFHLIEDRSIPLYIPYGKDGEDAIKPLKDGDISRSTMRKANHYCVNVPQKYFDILVREGAILQIDSDLNILNDMRYYQDDVGLIWNL